MPTKCVTPMAQINAYIKQQTQRRERVILRTLQYIGERCVNEARSYNGKAYTDQTGNLRSSVGYVVAIDGKIRTASAFEPIMSGANDGSQRGKAYAKALVSQFPKGAVLIVVAGERYAKYVAAKGYNVLQSAEQLAEHLCPQLLSQLGLAV